MAKRKDSDDGTVVLDGDDSPTLFIELDKANAEHKSLIAAARKFANIQAKRKKLFKEEKQKEDEAEQEVIEEAHKCGILKFRFGDLTVDVEQSEEVKVKVAASDDGGDSKKDD